MKNVKETCGTFDKAWEERRKTRAEELLAVSEAIQILTEDDAVDTAKAALGNDGFFLQMKSVRSKHSVRTLAAKALQKVARPRISNPNPREFANNFWYPYEFPNSLQNLDFLKTLRSSFSAVSTPMFASKYYILLGKFVTRSTRLRLFAPRRPQ